MNHAELKAQALSNPETLAAYESMDVEFSILRQMLAAMGFHWQVQQKGRGNS
ncbi:MAG: hypothetical protein WCP16_03345 [Pseudanabaena sp. ELA645]|jgi:hypothetical protein